MLATVEQPWPSILDIGDGGTWWPTRRTARCPTENFEAVDTTLVTIDNAADITPSDQLG